MGKQKPELPQGTPGHAGAEGSFAGGRCTGTEWGSAFGQLAEEMLKVEEGTLYPALYRIEQRGLDQERVGSIGIGRTAGAFLASSTRTGRKQLEEEEGEVVASFTGHRQGAADGLRRREPRAG